MTLQLSDWFIAILSGLSAGLLVKNISLLAELEDARQTIAILHRLAFPNEDKTDA